jgi:hypothetical protein
VRPRRALGAPALRRRGQSITCQDIQPRSIEHARIRRPDGPLARRRPQPDTTAPRSSHPRAPSVLPLFSQAILCWRSALGTREDRLRTGARRRGPGARSSLRTRARAPPTRLESVCVLSTVALAVARVGGRIRAGVADGCVRGRARRCEISRIAVGFAGEAEAEAVCFEKTVPTRGAVFVEAAP